MPAAAVPTQRRMSSYEEVPFKMPEIRQAKTVLWYPDRKRPEEFATAFVTQVGQSTIDVACIFPDYTTFSVKTGVRHISDPNTEIIDRAGNGVWDFAEDADSDKQLIVEMARAIKALEVRVQALEKPEKPK